MAGILQRLLEPIFPRRGNRAGFAGLLGGHVNGDGYNHEKRAGKPWENSTVAACVKAMLRMTTDAEVCAQKRASKSKGGQWETDWEHDLFGLLQNPNDDMDSTQMLDAIVISYVFSGEAFLWKRRAPSRLVTGLFWIRATDIDPIRPDDGSSYLSHYEYRVNGKIYLIPKEDIIHIKNGVDPENELRGWSDIKAALRAICTENESGNFINAVLHNSGVPFVVVTPDAANGKDGAIADPADFGERFMQKFGGSRRGQPFINSHALKVEVIGFDPKSLDLSTLKKLSQSDIAGLIGIPAVVVGLLVGLETATAKASHEESLWQAYVACILPMLKRIARQLTKGLVNDIYAPFGDSKKLRVWFDLSEVKCLGEDQDKLATRIAMLFEKGIIKRGQAQAALNYPVDAEKDEYSSPKAVAPVPAGDDAPAK